MAELGGATVSVTARESRASTATITLGAVAAVLSLAFLPVVLTQALPTDDEGFLLVTVREFVRHGGLYSQIRTEYGPFYFSVMAGLSHVLPGAPSPTVGRLTAMVFTALSAAMFGATVWRVTRSVAFGVLGEIVTFSVLIGVAGNEPMHPGALIVLVLSLVVFGLASYALEPKTWYLVLVGASIGALLMTKVNVGVFTVVAVTVVFVVANREFPELLGALAAAGAAVFPFLLMVQQLSNVLIAIFAMLVSLSLALVYVPMFVDPVRLPRRALAVIGVSALGAIGASCAWPLLTHTDAADLARGVLLRPFRQAHVLTFAFKVQIAWFPLIVTLAVLLTMLVRRRERADAPFGPAWLPTAALGFAGLAVLSLATLQSYYARYLSWLPAIVLIPTFAWMADVPERQRLVLRFLVPLAILEMLHAYPVAGSQTQWGLVTMCVPCVIAIAIAMQRVTIWQEAGPVVRATVIIVLGLIFVLGPDLSPVTEWAKYRTLTALDLPGTDLVRLPPDQVQEFRQLTAVVRAQCDTFYAAPGFDSLYLYTALPAPTGFLSSFGGALTTGEQRELAHQLATLVARGTRVCILRDVNRFDMWTSAYGNGPIVTALGQYQSPVAQVGSWTISRFGLSNVPS